MASKGAGLNLTPKPSSHLRSSSRVNSPTKHLLQNEQSLTLKRVIGTTTTSNNAFDCLESANCFGFTAGAVVVVATVDEDLHISQRFFRANPATGISTSTTPVYDSPTASGAPQTPRNRATPRHRDGVNRNSYFGSPAHEALESPSHKKATIRERVKTTTCLSFSPDSKLLAVGEAGHKPRVLIFSLAPDASTDAPLAILSEHSFGVRCVAFSPDSQCLATLGDVNDGFLHIWRVNTRYGSAVLHASNKCASYIRQIAWLGGSLITVGTRHVKIWRIEAPQQDITDSRGSETGSVISIDGLKTLLGRNCLLGPLLDQTFTAVTAISAEKAIVCSDQGNICMLNDVDSSPHFFKIAEAGFPVNAVAVRTSTSVVVAGKGGHAQYFSFNALTKHISIPESLVLVPGKLVRFNEPTESIRAMAFLRQHLITLDSGRGLRMVELKVFDDMPVSSSSKYHAPAHSSAVLGIQAISSPNALGASFLTWSAEGQVSFWSYEGEFVKAICIPLDQMQDCAESANELRVVRIWNDNAHVISGDRYGVIRVTRIDGNLTTFDAKAHSGEVTDIATGFKDASSVLASSGKDRMVQLYRWNADELELLQTLDEHVGSITGLSFTSDGQRLLSFSSDRTVVVRDSIAKGLSTRTIAAYLKSRTMVLKSTPTSMTLSSSNTVSISTNDRQILAYDVQSGNLVSGFKTADLDGGDSVVMSMISQASSERSQPMIAGVSNTDKSVRLYDDAGRLLARDYGHTEGITGLAMIGDSNVPRRSSIVTVAADGTIFIWSLPLGIQQLPETMEGLNTVEDPAKLNPMLTSKTPLRRVLSSSELARLQELRTGQDQGDSVTGGTPERPAQKRRPSKLSTSQTPNGKFSSHSNERRTAQSPTSATPERRHHRGLTVDHANMSSPREHSPVVKSKAQPASAAPVSRPRGKTLSTMGSASELNALVLATEQVCRSLHSYRKKLSASNDVLPEECAKELERELSATARAVAEKSARSKTAMVKLLDDYSERLVGFLDEKIEASVAREVGRRLEAEGEKKE